MNEKAHQSPTVSRGPFRGLIFDVGMHNGDDTAFYLGQGYRVVAVEADPALVENAKQRFSRETERGQLTVLNVGIAEQSGVSTFWICEESSVWNSFYREVAARNHSRHHAIQIPTKRFAEILEEYGVPVYLKIDIEGCDALCVRDLGGSRLPQFVSMECECGGSEEVLPEEVGIGALELLCSVGYRRFKLIDQRDYRTLIYPDRWRLARKIIHSAAYGRLRMPGTQGVAELFTTRQRLFRKNHHYFPEGSSGPWGEGTLGQWTDFQEAKRVYRLTRERHFRGITVPAFSFWCDWHATL